MRKALWLANRFEWRANSLSQQAKESDPETADWMEALALIFRDTANHIYHGTLFEQFYQWGMTKSDSDLASVIAGLAADHHRETSGRPNFPMIADILSQFMPGVEGASDPEALRGRVNRVSSTLRRGTPLRQCLEGIAASLNLAMKHDRNLRRPKTDPDRPGKSLPN